MWVGLGKSRFYQPYSSHPGFAMIFSQTSEQSKCDKYQIKPRKPREIQGCPNMLWGSKENNPILLNLGGISHVEMAILSHLQEYSLSYLHLLMPMMAWLSIGDRMRWLNPEVTQWTAERECCFLILLSLFKNVLVTNKELWCIKGKEAPCSKSRNLTK